MNLEWMFIAELLVLGACTGFLAGLLILVVILAVVPWSYVWRTYALGARPATAPRENASQAGGTQAQ